jgi:GT2 family glycosyltransferase
MPMDKIFAVVVTWNGAGLIGKCLDSLRRSTQPVQVVVVDNASTDGTMELVQRLCPQAALFRLSRNLGFGRACNIGIKYAYEQGAEHVLLINQDAFIEPEVILQLVDLQRAQPEYGVLAPLHLDATGAVIDFLFSQHFSKASGLRRLLGDFLLNKKVQAVYTAEFINAAIWMLSGECVRKVGLFNPVFEHYGEDMDFSDRLKFFGFRIGVVPGLHGYHAREQDSSSVNVNSGRILLQEKAILRYRLARHSHNAAFNLLSALSRIIFSSLPGRVSRLVALRIKAALFGTLVSNAPRVLHFRKRAYQGGLCFFKDTENDQNRYLITC